jgi:hypothetical protein
MYAFGLVRSDINEIIIKTIRDVLVIKGFFLFMVAFLNFVSKYKRLAMFNLSSLYVGMAIKYIIVLFVETPRKFITAKL